MSLFNKVLASVGIGAATVDTKLEKSTYTAGEVMRGEIEVRGGNVAQQVETIYLSVYTTFIREANDKKYTDKAAISKVKVADPFLIQAGENKRLTFSLTLPSDTPITVGKTKVWVQTELDIKNAVDPEDKDYIDVKPSKLVASVLDAVKGLGFRLRKTECEQTSARFRGHFPFMQEFEFAPTGSFRSHLDELEVVFLSQSEHSVEVLLQIDRKVKGLGSLFAEALDMDESFVRTTFTTQDVPTLQAKLQQIISNHI